MRMLASDIPQSAFRNPHSGMAYVAVLVLLMLMTTLGLAFLLKAGIEASATMQRSESMRTQYLAEAAANHAMWRLLHEPAFPASEDVYYMHTLGDGRYGYKVRRHTDTTFATVATVGATSGHATKQSYVLYVASAVTEPPPGTSQLVIAAYDTDAGGFDKTPKCRQFLDSLWGPEADTVAVGNRQVNWLELQGCPVREEAVMATLDDDHDIDLAVWDGTSWGNQMEFTRNADRSVKCFDVAYETLSGEALVVGRIGAGDVPGYTSWDGVSWLHDPPASAPATGGTSINNIVMASDPLDDEILLAMLDTNADITLFRWDGGAFSNLGLPSAKAPTSTRQAMDIAYEQRSGDAMVVWGTISAQNARYRIWNGTSLGPQGDAPNFGAQSQVIRAAADPTSDYICIAALDSASDLNVAIWDGDSWTDSRELEPSVAINDWPSGSWLSFAIAWEHSSGELLLFWGQANTTTLRYARWSKGTPLSDSAVQVGPELGGELSTIDALPLLGADKIIVLVGNGNDELRSAVWDGDGFLDDPAVLLSTDISERNMMPFDVAGPSVGGGAILGNPAEGDSEQKSVEQMQIATRFDLSQNITVTAISAFVAGPPSKKIRYAIYSDSAGEPNALLVETVVEAIGSTSFHWHEINVAPTSLAAGTYWLALAFEHGSVSYSYTYEAQGQTRYKNHDAVDHGFLPSWGSSDASLSRVISIYAIGTSD